MPIRCANIRVAAVVAHYSYWMALKLRSIKAYSRKKLEVLIHLLDAVEQHYVPDLRRHNNDQRATVRIADERLPRLNGAVPLAYTFALPETCR